MTPSHCTDLAWQNARDRLIVSPASGGRVLSWVHEGMGELAWPAGEEDGGLARILLSLERYPGSSFSTPHRLISHEQNEQGFRIHLQHYWNTSNAIAEALGWLDKRNPCYLDGLLLDKIISFDAQTSALGLELTITNLNDSSRTIAPWVHYPLKGHVKRGVVMRGDTQEPFSWREIYWGGHRIDGDEPARLIHAITDRKESLVLGVAPGAIDGFASYAEPDTGKLEMNGMELRGRTICLEPDASWHCTSFLAVTRDPARWAKDSPIELRCEIETGKHENRNKWNPRTLLPLLRNWAIPAEHEAGIMALSHLDKVPFTSTARYNAANCFAGFHKEHGKAVASVQLFTLRKFTKLSATLEGADKKWRLLPIPLRTASDKLIPLILQGPLDMRGCRSLHVHVCDAERELFVLSVATDSKVEPVYTYQVQQTSAYLDERFRQEKQPFSGKTKSELITWQAAGRQRMRNWAMQSIKGTCDLSPRLMERQVGPLCVRDKILLQVEPNVWLPTYVVYPRSDQSKNSHTKNFRGAILFPHGSCSGKRLFAPDETMAMHDPSTFDGWPTPYLMAHRMNCVVMMPDVRGWGEWSEANHGQRRERATQAGYNLTALAVWDHLRAVDYLASRPDVDPNKIVSMGSSGGGWMTIFMAAAADRLAGGIVSSSPVLLPSIPDDFFFRVTEAKDAKINPAPNMPMSTAMMLSLAAPRPLWIMDGKEDRCALTSLTLDEAENQKQFAKFRADNDAGRNEVARIYKLMGASKQYQATWFDGAHLAGFNFRNIAMWMRQHFDFNMTL